MLNSVISVLLCQETATWGGCDLGNSGVWDGLPFQPGPGGKRKDRPELFFPRGFTPPSDGLESRPCPTHPLGIRVWDASRLIDPRNVCTPL